MRKNCTCYGKMAVKMKSITNVSIGCVSRNVRSLWEVPAEQWCQICHSEHHTFMCFRLFVLRKRGYFKVERANAHAV